MNREDARKAAKVMLAYADGAEIEELDKFLQPKRWTQRSGPGFDWSQFDYRVKQTPDSINWDHIAPGYKWMARGKNGQAFIYGSRPNYSPHGMCVSGFLNAPGDSANVLASYKRGTVDWKDSLVERPSGEGSA